MNRRSLSTWNRRMSYQATHGKWLASERRSVQLRIVTDFAREKLAAEVDSTIRGIEEDVTARVDKQSGSAIVIRSAFQQSNTDGMRCRQNDGLLSFFVYHLKAVTALRHDSL